VLIQTAFPQHALFDALRSQDYVSFANELLQERQAMQFPPASFFALLRAESNKFTEVEKFLHLARNAARNLTNNSNNDVMVYDIIRPQMERLKGMERGQLLLQASSRAALQRLLKAWMPEIKGFLLANKVRWSIDIDPLEF
jgi:primosomal protein N' (replication factor Y) (superfamily II helicase)